MFGSLGNLAGLMKTAKDLQANMAKLQADMVNRRYDAEVGGGAVKATVDGRGTLLALKIDQKSTLDVELLEDLVVAAVNSAVLRSQEAMKAEMASLTGGMNLPGLQDLLNGAK